MFAWSKGLALANILYPRNFFPKEQHGCSRCICDKMEGLTTWLTTFWHRSGSSKTEASPKTRTFPELTSAVITTGPVIMNAMPPLKRTVKTKTHSRVQFDLDKLQDPNIAVTYPEFWATSVNSSCCPRNVSQTEKKNRKNNDGASHQYKEINKNIDHD